jgi:glycosyltransferase involved in cell wall biosynthesis
MGGDWPGFVSVVVPVRNGADTIGEQLKALSLQDYGGRWEVIISDNGSDDGTLAIVDEWRERLPSVRVVDSSDALGASHARNVGFAAARGRFIALCDADDVVSPSWLRELVAESGPGVVVTGSHEVITLNDPLTLAWTSWTDPRRTTRAVDPIVRGSIVKFGFLPFGMGCNLGLDRAVWEAIGGWTVGITAEDVDFCWRAQLAGFEWRTAPKALISYRLRGTIRSMMRQYYSYGRGDVEVYVRFRDRGCPAPSRERTLRTYASLLYRVPQALVSDAWRGRWCRLVAYRAGRLAGSMRHGVAFL